MIINEMLYKRNWSKHRLAKEANIPYSTIEDIFSCKTKIENLTLGNSIKLAKALNINIEDVIKLQNRTDEDVFRSNICHDLSNNGDYKFIEKTLESNEINKLFKFKLYFECLYLLSMLDYVSRRNNIPVAKEYEQLRELKLDSISYPKSLLHYCDNSQLIAEFDESIPEFKMHNIAEREIDNVA